MTQEPGWGGNLKQENKVKYVCSGNGWLKSQLEVGI